MNSLDRLMGDYPFQAMMLGIIARTMMLTWDKQEYLRLAGALGREPHWKDCLRYLDEKSKHDDLMRARELKRCLDQEAKDREAVHRLIWSSNV